MVSTQVFTLRNLWIRKNFVDSLKLICYVARNSKIQKERKAMAAKKGTKKSRGARKGAGKGTKKSASKSKYRGGAKKSKKAAKKSAKQATKKAAKKSTKKRAAKKSAAVAPPSSTAAQSDVPDNVMSGGPTGEDGASTESEAVAEEAS